MAPEYIFARHGESTVNLTRTITNGLSDYCPLTERGREQAKELLKTIQNRQVISVYASPLMRAKETGQIIAGGFGLEVEIVDGLREPYCGIAEGRNDQEAWGMHWAQEQAWRAGNFDHHIPGGESLNDVRSRFLPCIESMVIKHQDDTGSVVIISHGSTLSNMLPMILSNIDWDYARANPLINCAYVVAAMTESGLLCVDWNGRAMERPGM